MNPSMYKRLNVNVPWDDYSAYQHLAISDRSTVSKMIRAVVADEPMIRRLRSIVADLNSGDAKMPPPDTVAESSYRTMSGAVWEYRLPSGRIAKVVKTPSSGSFLIH